MDIETTGFDADSEVTVIGFAIPMGVRVMVQTGGRSAAGVEQAVEAATDTLINVTLHPTERALVDGVEEFVHQRLRDADVLLVTFNGERWDGGFDLPFLRTRYARLNADWPFEDVPFSDIMPLVKDRFNTILDGDGADDLVSAYDLLSDGEYSQLDPFADSQEAVAAFEEGRFSELVLHNVSDVLRTRALGQIAERYLSKSEFRVKSLTPTRAI